MPFAQIYMLEGRTEEQKRAVIEKVTIVPGILSLKTSLLMTRLAFDESIMWTVTGIFNYSYFTTYYLARKNYVFRRISLLPL